MKSMAVCLTVVQRVEMLPKTKVANEVIYQYHFKGTGIIIF